MHQMPELDLRGIRREYGWTQQDLAKKLGFSRAYIATIESGRQGISANMMYKIIRKLGLKYEDFFKCEETG